jgi:ABC-type transporter Mla MlaB component
VKPKPTFELVMEAGRNLTHLRYFGTVTAAQMPECVRQIESTLPQLRTGFTMLVDLSGLDAMELECVPYLSTIMELCKGRGLGTVIRVIPDPSKDIGLNILSLIHYRGKVRVMTCGTLAEAQRLLA